MKTIQFVCKLFLIVAISILLIACSEKLSVTDQYRNLQVETKMSHTVFLLPSKSRVVYLQIKNQTGYGDLNFEKKLKSMLNYEGFKITTNMKKADYLIDVNLLQLSKVPPVEADKILYSTFGAVLLSPSSVSTTNQEQYSDMALETCMLVVDAEISEHLDSGWHRYKTRIVSYSQKPNFNCEDIAAHLSSAVAKSISRLF